MAYFPIVDIVVMVTLTTVECCVLLLQSSCIDITLENLLSAPPSECVMCSVLLNVPCFLSYTFSDVDVVVSQVGLAGRSLGCLCIPLYKMCSLFSFYFYWEATE